MHTEKRDILDLMDRMDKLLDTPKGDIPELINALRAVTTSGSSLAGLSQSKLLTDWIVGSMNVCTAYVQFLIVKGTDIPYADVVKRYRDQVGTLALTHTER